MILISIWIMSKNLNLLTNRDMDVKTVTFFNSRDINLEKNYFFFHFIMAIPLYSFWMKMLYLRALSVRTRQTQKWPSRIFLSYPNIKIDYMAYKIAKYFFLNFIGFWDIEVNKPSSVMLRGQSKKVKLPYFSKYTMDFNSIFWRDWA